MRRFSLGLTVVTAAVLAMPASGREFRTDAFNCSDDAATTCWELADFTTGLPAAPAGTLPLLPIGTNTFSRAGNLISTIGSGMDFFTSNFAMTAFDFQAFLSGPPAIVYPSSPDTIEPQIWYGLTRSTGGTPWIGNETPLLRVDWRFNFDALGGFTDVFVPFPSDFPGSVGVQLLFGSEPDGGFQLNGLASGGYQYAFSSDRLGNPIWSGADQPCDTFANDGTCIGISSVPEPSSVALLGLGFLALAFGMRTGNPMRARLT